MKLILRPGSLNMGQQHILISDIALIGKVKMMPIMLI